MTTTTAPAFPARYAAAWTALKTARLHSAPMDADLAATLAARYPAKFAQMEVEVAAIAATVPALQAAYDALDELACGHCAGTGEYQGASRYIRHGVKVCFTCGGSGMRKR